MKEACGRELQQYCSGIQPGGDRLIRCLTRQSDLSDRCKAFLNPMQEACGRELQQYCSRIQPGGGRLIQCLTQQSDLSDRCKTFLQVAVVGCAPEAGRVVQCVRPSDTDAAINGILWRMAMARRQRHGCECRQRHRLSAGSAATMRARTRLDCWRSPLRRCGFQLRTSECSITTCRQCRRHGSRAIPSMFKAFRVRPMRRNDLSS